MLKLLLSNDVIRFLRGVVVDGCAKSRNVRLEAVFNGMDGAFKLGESWRVRSFILQSSDSFRYNFARGPFVLGLGVDKIEAFGVWREVYELSKEWDSSFGAPNSVNGSVEAADGGDSVVAA